MPTVWRPTSRRLRVWAWISVAILCGGIAPPFAQPSPQRDAPEPRALLIGVGRYQNLPASFRLLAPGGDVRRLRAALTEAGYPAHRIEIMTEDSPRIPTRGSVLGALDRLASEAEPGQEILIYVSGHGAQVRARYPAREADGLEELYLMADADEADGPSGIVPGAIADFELEAAISRIRAGGAHVVLIADACHAAGVTRSSPSDGRIKGLSGADLGLTDLASLRSAAQDPTPVIGDFTGVFAAAPGSLAVERSLPLGRPEAEPASAFTYALAQALRDGRHRTWRDVQDGLRDAAVEAGPGPVPVFEGRLDQPPAGLDPGRSRWFRTYTSGAQTLVAAGALEGLVAGDILDLADASGTVIGQAQISDSDALTARLLSPAVGAIRARRRTAGEPSAFLSAVRPYLVGPDAAPLSIRGHVWPGSCDSSPPRDPGAGTGVRPLDLRQTPRLSHCDVLYVRLSNTSGSAVDAAVFFVNAAGSATPLTFAPDDGPRLGPGQARHSAVRILTRDADGGAIPAGREAIVITWAPARGRTPRDLRALARTIPQRGADEGQFGALLLPILTTASPP